MADWNLRQRLMARIVLFDVDNKDTLTLTLGGDNLQGVIGVRVGESFITIDELDYKSEGRRCWHRNL